MKKMENMKIIHIDMDAFYASVEQRDHPEYRGKPLAVGRPEERGVVAAASYEARKFGIRSAMSSMQALKLCPDLIFVRGRMEHYKAVSEEIHRTFHEYTDLIEPLALDEAFLDVTENKKNIPLAVDIAGLLKKRFARNWGWWLRPESLIINSWRRLLRIIANRTVFLLSIPVKQLLLSLVCLSKYFGGSVK